MAASISAAVLMGSAARADEQITLKVAYPGDFEPAVPALATAWWNDIVAQFQKKHPNVKVDVQAIPGGFSDSESKIALLFKSKSTAPDVVGLADLNYGQWVSTGYLLPIQDRLDATSWWAKMNPLLKNAETTDGKVYAVSQGVNTFALLYDKTLFKQAGIPTPWAPKTWADVLDAAKKLKSVPDISPLWMPTGTSQGTFGVFAGPGTFLAGSSDQTVLTKDGKWVVDSKGIREVVSFYKDAAQAGLLPPSSQIMDTMAEAVPPADMPKHKIGICLSGNWFADLWTKDLSSPYWPEAANDIGVTPLPTINGATPGVSSMIGGWTLSIGSASKHPDLAWELIDIAQQRENMLQNAVAVALVPSIPAYSQDSDFLKVAPTFRGVFAKIAETAQLAPLDPNYSVWAQGFLTGTQAVVVKPDTTVDDAVNQMKDYITNQLGPDAVVTLQ
ncbi:extracellular solute-binding protein [Mesorhizobium sp. VK24D]|uniref:Extracellular solute-binding protein n=1 Tax=Mesorhizobium album TaxID=3072314 RepID=A0ABU4Y6K1_9HYPH|nr:extracellular solute-binding protein [Mesorhizobium sp. VK24D]MDX8482564.1 extracellular solute-binding protein [Mesorhizobium sp. VK24D]